MRWLPPRPAPRSGRWPPLGLAIDTGAVLAEAPSQTAIDQPLERAHLAGCVPGDPGTNPTRLEHRHPRAAALEQQARRQPGDAASDYSDVDRDVASQGGVARLGRGVDPQRDGPPGRRPGYCSVSHREITASPRPRRREARSAFGPHSAGRGRTLAHIGRRLSALLRPSLRLAYRPRRRSYGDRTRRDHDRPALSVRVLQHG